MLFAPRGVGKTHVALEAAYAVATGSSFLRWHAPEPHPVLIIDGEMPAGTLQERLTCISNRHGVEPPLPDYLQHRGERPPLGWAARPVRSRMPMPLRRRARRR